MTILLHKNGQVYDITHGMPGRLDDDSQPFQKTTAGITRVGAAPAQPGGIMNLAAQPVAQPVTQPVAQPRMQPVAQPMAPPITPPTMQLSSGAHLIDPAQVAAQRQLQLAMPTGLTEQQQFDYLNPRKQPIANPAPAFAPVLNPDLVHRLQPPNPAMLQMQPNPVMAKPPMGMASLAPQPVAQPVPQPVPQTMAPRVQPTMGAGLALTPQQVQQRLNSAPQPAQGNPNAPLFNVAMPMAMQAQPSAGQGAGIGMGIGQQLAGQQFQANPNYIMGQMPQPGPIIVPSMNPAAMPFAANQPLG